MKVLWMNTFLWAKFTLIPLGNMGENLFKKAEMITRSDYHPFPMTIVVKNS